jgi:hypothetical protein
MKQNKTFVQESLHCFITKIPPNKKQKELVSVLRQSLSFLSDESDVTGLEETE